MRALIRLVVVVVMIAAGAASWFGVERYVLADDANTLPSLGDGLPLERLDVPAEPWRRFEFRRTSGDDESIYAFDLDADEFSLMLEMADGTTGPGAEGRGHVGYRQTDDGSWIALTEREVEVYYQFRLAESAPLLLTDLIPPAIVPYTTVLRERDENGIRIYEITVDVATLRTERPIDHSRWLLSSDDDVLAPVQMSVTVRKDGYVVSVIDPIDRVTWSDLDGPIVWASPMSTLAPPAVSATNESTTSAPPTTVL
jgi:hypothetical protein